MKKAVCYIRVSTQEQVREGVSLAAQEERICAYCTMAGLEIVAVIRDEGISGSKPLVVRPGGAELLGMLNNKKNKIQHVVALKLDRLFRDAEDALHQTKAWDKAGVDFHLVDMGGQSFNTASPMGRMMLTMMAGFAEMERGLIAERTEAALAHKKAHREAYAPTPMGFDREGNSLVVNEEEQRAVKFIREQREAGKSLRDIAGQLNDQGIPTKKGGKWHASTIKYILNNNLYGKEVA